MMQDKAICKQLLQLFIQECINGTILKNDFEQTTSRWCPLPIISKYLRFTGLPKVADYTKT